MRISPIVRSVLFAGATGLCLWGAASDRPLVGPAAVACVLVAHTWTLAESVRQLRPLLVLTVVGTGAESAWIAAGLYAPAGSMRGALLCPLWVTALWLNLAIFAQGALLPRLSPRFALTAGMIVAPLSYLAADAAGAILVAWPLAAAWPALAAYGACALAGTMVLLASAESPTHSERRA